MTSSEATEVHGDATGGVMSSVLLSDHRQTIDPSSKQKCDGAVAGRGPIGETPSAAKHLDLTNIIFDFLSHDGRCRFDERPLVLQRSRIFQTQTRVVYPLWPPRTYRQHPLGGRESRPSRFVPPV